MKPFVSALVLSVVIFGANAAPAGRATMAGKMIMSAPRQTASINQLNAGANLASTASINQINTGANLPGNTATDVTVTEEIDRREAERNACINNNIGIGNTFVWASRYSDTSNYATMTEDVDNPQNNVCFVRVELKSDDASRVSVSDVPAKYFMWGETIECGSWANAKEIEQRILDARKGNRIGGVVAASVGGAGVGVGAMELFGNKLIGGKVQGQKADKMTTYKSYMEYLKTNNSAKYQEVVNAIELVKKAQDFSGFETDEQNFIKNN